MAVTKKPRRLNGSGSRLKTSGKKVISTNKIKISPIKKVVKKTVKKTTVLDLKKSKKNPIIKPISERYWESKATFNPTAIVSDGKIHIIYRAIGDSDNSVLGYAGTDDGFTIKDSSSSPVYYNFMRHSSDRSLP